MSSRILGASPFTRRAFIRSAAIAGAGVAALDLLAACGGSSSAGPITITTNELPASSDPASLRIYHDVIQGYQRQHPNVTISGRNDPYDPKTFFAKAAAHTQEDVLYTYFTEPPLMIQRHTVAPITDLVKKQSFYSSYAPGVLSIVTGPDGAIYGLPYGGYALGLMFSKKIVKAAGIDPNTPPKTWDDFREYAKRIAATGVHGFVELTKDNTGGWHLTNWTYTGGGDMETKSGNQYKASFNNDHTIAWLKLLQTMKHVDKSVYPDVLVGYNDALQIFAAGKAGMVVESADTLAPLKTSYQMDITDVGLWPMPQNGGNATLTGGSAYVFKPSDSPEVLDAAVAWGSYYRFDLGVYEDTSARNSAAGLPVGAPGNVLFTGTYQAQREAIDKKYANLPLDNYATFTSATLTLRPEPPVLTQQMYGTLDSVVQQTLSDANADPKALLDAAVQQFQPALDSAAS